MKPAIENVYIEHICQQWKLKTRQKILGLYTHKIRFISLVGAYITYCNTARLIEHDYFLIEFGIN